MMQDVLKENIAPMLGKKVRYKCTDWPQQQENFIFAKRAVQIIIIHMTYFLLARYK